MRTTLLTPDPEDPTSTILEPYRLWSFVLKKANTSWIWMALCCKTCQRLWEAIPPEYRQGHCKTRLFERLYFCHP